MNLETSYISDRRGCVPVDLSHVERLQREIDDLRGRFSGETASALDSELERQSLGRIASDIVRARRRRALLFGDGFFGEPAWDVLLELYVAEGENRRLSVSGACHASGVPPTTALRWVIKLERMGWISREPDAQDGRRFWLQLSDKGAKSVQTFLLNMVNASTRWVTSTQTLNCARCAA